MSSTTVSQDRDANRQLIFSNSAFKVSKTVTFLAGTTGAIDFTDIFTVTGDVFIDMIFAVCNTDLDSGGSSTISLGTANNVTGLKQTVTATAIDEGDIWFGSNPELEVGSGWADGDASIWAVTSVNIGYDILTATITAGELEFYCLWRPLSDDGSVEAA